MVDLTARLSGLTLKNPVIGASGCFGFGREFNEWYDIGRLGGIAVKGLTLKPSPGNPLPRIAETAAGMLNSIGLQNPGVDAFISEELPWLRGRDLAVIANINGHSVKEFALITEKLNGVEGVHALEVNISCPNVEHGGMFFGTDPQMAAEVVRSVRCETRLPLIVKLTPNVTDITEIARAAEAEGADIISLINTVAGMAIDIKKRRPVLPRGVGGLSGPAVKPVALRMVWETAGAVSVPVIGMGGITDHRDALEFLMAGAAAVAVGTGNFRDPMTGIRIVDGLTEWMEEEGVHELAQVIGAARFCPA
ncbi:MAG: dihydroorotate dehydrogenase [Peptococcaceae bacterium]|jgi:dihydroorotate dehydrogenase (NAD+) catalytic subunit|nr:dihydroorotate dehydrogenase [Peptococcaceae bacterium]